MPPVAAPLAVILFLGTMYDVQIGVGCPQVPRPGGQDDRTAEDVGAHGAALPGGYQRQQPDRRAQHAPRQGLRQPGIYDFAGLLGTACGAPAIFSACPSKGRAVSLRCLARGIPGGAYSTQRSCRVCSSYSQLL